MATVTVWEKIGDEEAVEREFELDPVITGDIASAREYCKWANQGNGTTYYTSNPDEIEE